MESVAKEIAQSDIVESIRHSRTKKKCPHFFIIEACEKSGKGGSDLQTAFNSLVEAGAI